MGLFGKKEEQNPNAGNLLLPDAPREREKVTRQVRYLYVDTRESDYHVSESELKEMGVLVPESGEMLKAFIDYLKSNQWFICDGTAVPATAIMYIEQGSEDEEA